jgi:hypothetical protein
VDCTRIRERLQSVLDCYIGSVPRRNAGKLQRSIKIILRHSDWLFLLFLGIPASLAGSNQHAPKHTHERSSGLGTLPSKNAEFQQEQIDIMCE